MSAPRRPKDQKGPARSYMMSGSYDSEFALTFTDEADSSDLGLAIRRFGKRDDKTKLKALQDVLEQLRVVPSLPSVKENAPALCHAYDRYWYHPHRHVRENLQHVVFELLCSPSRSKEERNAVGNLLPDFVASWWASMFDVDRTVRELAIAAWVGAFPDEAKRDAISLRFVGDFFRGAVKTVTMTTISSLQKEEGFSPEAADEVMDNLLSSTTKCVLWLMKKPGNNDSSEFSAKIKGFLSMEELWASFKSGTLTKQSLLALLRYLSTPHCLLPVIKLSYDDRFVKLTVEAVASSDADFQSEGVQSLLVLAQRRDNSVGPSAPKLFSRDALSGIVRRTCCISRDSTGCEVCCFSDLMATLPQTEDRSETISHCLFALWSGMHSRSGLSLATYSVIAKDFVSVVLSLISSGSNDAKDDALHLHVSYLLHDFVLASPSTKRRFPVEHINHLIKAVVDEHGLGETIQNIFIIAQDMPEKVTFPPGHPYGDIAVSPNRESVWNALLDLSNALILSSLDQSIIQLVCDFVQTVLKASTATVAVDHRRLSELFNSLRHSSYEEATSMCAEISGVAVAALQQSKVSSQVVSLMCPLACATTSGRRHVLTIVKKELSLHRFRECTGVICDLIESSSLQDDERASLLDYLLSITAVVFAEGTTSDIQNLRSMVKSLRKAQDSDRLEDAYYDGLFSLRTAPTGASLEQLLLPTTEHEACSLKHHARAAFESPSWLSASDIVLLVQKLNVVTLTEVLTTLKKSLMALWAVSSMHESQQRAFLPPTAARSASVTSASVVCVRGLLVLLGLGDLVTSNIEALAVLVLATGSLMDDLCLATPKLRAGVLHFLTENKTLLNVDVAEHILQDNVVLSSLPKLLPTVCHWTLEHAAASAGGGLTCLPPLVESTLQRYFWATKTRSALQVALYPLVLRCAQHIPVESAILKAQLQPEANSSFDIVRVAAALGCIDVLTTIPNESIATIGHVLTRLEQKDAFLDGTNPRFYIDAMRFALGLYQERLAHKTTTTTVTFPKDFALFLFDVLTQVYPVSYVAATGGLRQRPPSRVAVSAEQYMISRSVADGLKAVWNAIPVTRRDASVAMGCDLVLDSVLRLAEAAGRDNAAVLATDDFVAQSADAAMALFASRGSMDASVALAAADATVQTSVMGFVNKCLACKGGVAVTSVHSSLGRALVWAQNILFGVAGPAGSRDEDAEDVDDTTVTALIPPVLHSVFTSCLHLSEHPHDYVEGAQVLEHNVGLRVACHAYLVSWVVVVRWFCETQSKTTRGDFDRYVRSGQCEANFMECVMTLSALDGYKLANNGHKSGKKFMFGDLISTIPSAASDDAHRESLEHIALTSFAYVLRATPATIRPWHSEAQVSAIERFVSHCVAPVLTQEAHHSVLTQAGTKKSVDEATGVTTFTMSDGNATVKVGSRVVSVVYDQDGNTVKLKLTVPEAFPLTPIRASVDELEQSLRVAAGVRREVLRHWVLKITAELTTGNSTLWDILTLWVKNLESQFDGKEPCPICYSVVHSENMRLPELKCGVCTNVIFHKKCLHDWFRGSGNNTCPTCRTPWNSWK